MEKQKVKAGTTAQRKYVDSGKKENVREGPTADIYTPQHRAQGAKADGTRRTYPKTRRCAMTSRTTERVGEATIADSHTGKPMNKPT